MKAIAVVPGTPNSVHLADLEKPSLSDIPGGRGVLVRVLRVGVDGTDKEINAAEYGAAPEGYDFLVIGHEGFGQVEAVGPNVTFLQPGDFVVATVRRPGTSLYDAIGLQDMTTDAQYFERGINLRHGYLTEHYVEDEEFVVKIPQGLEDVGVLLEPMTVAQKGITQAYEIQRRLKVWKPEDRRGHGRRHARPARHARAAAARPRRHDVRPHAAAVSQRRPARAHRRTLCQHERARYRGGGGRARPVRPDLRGHGIVGGRVRRDAGARRRTACSCCQRSPAATHRLEVPADRINLDFVLGNKVMVGTVNASRENFETGVRDMSQAEAEYPGWLGRLADAPGPRPGQLRRTVPALAESERRDQDLLRGGYPMTCREFADFMADYLSDELMPDQRSSFDRHLAVCPTCVAYLKDYEATIRLGRAAFDEPEAPVPDGVPPSLVTAILAARKR